MYRCINVVAITTDATPISGQMGGTESEVVIWEKALRWALQWKVDSFLPNRRVVCVAFKDVSSGYGEEGSVQVLSLEEVEEIVSSRESLEQFILDTKEVA